MAHPHEKHDVHKQSALKSVGVAGAALALAIVLHVGVQHEELPLPACSEDGALGDCGGGALEHPERPWPGVPWRGLSPHVRRATQPPGAARRRGGAERGRWPRRLAEEVGWACTRCACMKL
jgi:hypothetical protein